MIVSGIASRPACHCCLARKSHSRWRTGSSKVCGGSRGLQFPTSGRRSASRGRLLVEANELNKWGDTDGRDEDAGLDDDGFDNDTSAVVLRVLTARAVQKMLLQLQETNLHTAAFLSDFCSKNPPIEGNKFLLKLLQERPVVQKDRFTSKDHSISPMVLVDRIILVREAMAKTLISRFSGFVARDNVDVLRMHIEKNSYISGSHAPRKKS